MFHPLVCRFGSKKIQFFEALVELEARAKHLEMIIHYTAAVLKNNSNKCKIDRSAF
jgi:hypothetical protein